ncbi:hypothetical protein [Flavivirga rizhaonensis]|uniref:hypothetical protein n=1 Tax=Flavivirga rizhaonensis TaxID=2559571 RepID=UPI001477507B|nr:hypothetical protein [Flavivirga rizhaonensis]
MKALKITLFVALLMLTLVSCTKQDLNEDDVLRADENTEEATNTGIPTPYTGGDIDN